MADTTLAPRPSSSGGPIPEMQNLGQDASSSNEADNYKPLPIGNWILPFHGNCPRCHHYHRAVQVKIKVTHDPSPTNYIHCDNCDNNWAAFGGRNCTHISLLSTTTTEPDLSAKEVRLKLIDIVNIAAAKSAIGTLNEARSAGPELQRCSDAPMNDESARSAGRAHTVASRNEDDVSTDLTQEPQRLGPTRALTRSTSSAKPRSPMSRLLSKARLKLTARLSVMYRGHAQRPLDEPTLPVMSTRQFDKSPVRTPLATEADAVAVMEVSVKPHPSNITGQEDTTTSIAKATVPVKRMAEVAAFIRSLDTTVLDSMDDTERAMWMRRAYTQFKTRNRGSTARPTLPSIVETSTSHELHPSSGRVNRRSNEVRGAGAHIEDLESVQLPSRRISLAMSDLTDDIFAPDDNTGRSTPQNPVRPRSQQLQRVIDLDRPQPVPSAPPSPRRLYQRERDFFDICMYRRLGSTWSLRGQPASLWSEGSTTVCGSTITLQQNSSQETVRRPESFGVLEPESVDLQPPHPTFARNYSDSPPPPSTPRESFESTRDD